MAKLILPRLASLTNEESAVQLFDQWAELLEEAFELTLSRNGQTPNTMSANLDLNSNRLLNLAAPIDDNDAVRLVDVVDGIKGDKGDTGPAGSVTDGDKGDIVVSGSGATWTLDSGVVTAQARALLDDTTQAAMRTTLGLGNSATLNTGTTAGTVALGNDNRFAHLVPIEKDFNYTFQVVDDVRYIRHTSASAHSWTIDPQASTTYLDGTTYVLRNIPGAGNVTLTRGAGVNLYINGSTVSANGTISPGAIVTLIRDSSDNWVAVGPGIA